LAARLAVILPVTGIRNGGPGFGAKVGIVPAVTSSRVFRPYILLIEHGSWSVNWTHKIATLALAAALLLPGVLATMNQAAQIVA
jgi:hypothetical protein